ncbi:MAG: glycosidase [Planctomycetes bacterium]|nr:glycosidase [Planctomycetota bacterium]
MGIDRSERRSKRRRDIVHRWQGNPLIDITDLDFKCSDIHNAGTIVFEGEILLLVTIEHLAGRRCIHLARCNNDHYTVDKTPFLKPSEDAKYKQHESHGVLDARITFLEGVYYIMYIALGDHGYRLGLAKTHDFVTIERIGIISEPDTKTGVLFPQKIKGRYARLERPRHGHSVWITYSDDLIHWGASEMVISPRDGFWDSSRIGVGSVPIEIEQGWLVLYYGAKDTSAGSIYRIGAIILDKEHPEKVIGRAGIPILSPRENYERIGDVPNIVFSTGAILTPNGEINIYYGAANSCICIGTTTVNNIVATCMQSKEEY